MHRPVASGPFHTRQKLRRKLRQREKSRATKLHATTLSGKGKFTLHVRQILAALLVIALPGSALAACSTDQQQVGAGFIVVQNSEPQSPLYTTDTNETGGGDILRMLYSGLVRYDTDGSMILDHAAEIKPNEDSTHFDITLKPGWTFHNGEPVTAQSYIDAWNYAAYGPNLQKQQSFFANVQGFDAVSGEKATEKTLSGLKKVDDLRFTVDLTNPDSSFPLSLGYVAFMPLPKAAFEDKKAFGEHPIGNGPYKMAEGRAWLHNNQLTVVRNDDFAGEHKARNNGLVYRFYSDVDTAYADLQAGRLDTLPRTIPPTALASFQTDFPDSSANVPTSSSQYFAIPRNLPGFSGEEGKLRRQAISMAIDRKLITEKFFFDTRTPAREFSSLTLGDLDPNVPGQEVLEYNPKKARQLWAEANKIAPFTGSFDIAYNADGGHQQWVEAVTNMIGETLGIDSHGKAYPTFKQLRDEISNETITSGYRTGWAADYPSVANYMLPQFVTGGSSNDNHYSNPEFDKLIQEAASAKSAEDAKPIYVKAQSVLMEDLPAIPLWYPNASVAWNPKLRNAVVMWDGILDYPMIEKD